MIPQTRTEALGSLAEVVHDITESTVVTHKMFVLFNNRTMYQDEWTQKDRLLLRWKENDTVRKYLDQFVLAR